jgi:hypothetical protein
MLDPTVLLADVAIDDEHVIVATQYEDAKLFVVSYDGTERRDLVTGAGPGCARVVADGAGIFVAAGTGLYRIDKTTGAQVELAGPLPSFISNLALDDEGAAESR